MGGCSVCQNSPSSQCALRRTTGLILFIFVAPSSPYTPHYIAKKHSAGDRVEGAANLSEIILFDKLSIPLTNGGGMLFFTTTKARIPHGSCTFGYNCESNRISTKSERFFEKPKKANEKEKENEKESQK